LEGEADQHGADGEGLEPPQVPQLPGNAVVIRGGGMANLDEMRLSILEEGGVSGRFGLSVCCRSGMTANQIAQLVGNVRLPHPRMRETTVQALRDVGVDVALDEENEGPGHALVIFNDAPTQAELSAVVQVFGPPQDNPVRR